MQGCRRGEAPNPLRIHAREFFKAGEVPFHEGAVLPEKLDSRRYNRCCSGRFLWFFVGGSVTLRIDPGARPAALDARPPHP
jgi:hypothetical protein